LAVTPPEHENELSEMALEELDAACGLHFVEMKQITPWGDTYDAMAPSGREVEVERRYLWQNGVVGGAIVIEVEVRDPVLQTGAEARAVIGQDAR